RPNLAAGGFGALQRLADTLFLAGRLLEVDGGQRARVLLNAGDGLARLLDALANLLVELRGALRELAHLVGDDREAAAGLAGARRLDARVQREQVGLLGEASRFLENPEYAVQMAQHALGIARHRDALTADVNERVHEALQRFGRRFVALDTRRGGAVRRQARLEQLRLRSRDPVQPVEVRRKLGDRFADEV